MFDVGFSEMIVIAVVALIVLGPEKLPRVARTVGALLGRMQRYVNDVKADINREIELDELKKMHTSVKDAAQSFESSVRDTMTSFESQANDLKSSVTGDTVAAAAETPAAPPPMSDADLAAAIMDAQAQADLPTVEEALAAPAVVEPDPAQGMLALDEPAPAPVAAPAPHAAEAAPARAPEPLKPAA